MSIKSLTKRWTDANIYDGGGAGKDGYYWFRNHILFYQTVPYKRFVNRKNKPSVILTLDRDGFAFKPGNIGSLVTLSVPDIGVYSIFSGDYLDDREMHERMSMIMTAQIRDYINEELTAMTGGEGKGKIQDAMNKLHSFVNRWNNYRNLFDLKWDTVSGLWLRTAEGMMEAKVAAWEDPINIEKRKREQSRRMLKKALDL